MAIFRPILSHSMKWRQMGLIIHLKWLCRRIMTGNCIARLALLWCVMKIDEDKKKFSPLQKLEKFLIKEMSTFTTAVEMKEVHMDSIWARISLLQSLMHYFGFFFTSSSGWENVRVRLQRARTSKQSGQTLTMTLQYCRLGLWKMKEKTFLPIVMSIRWMPDKSRPFFSFFLLIPESSTENRW